MSLTGGINMLLSVLIFLAIGALAGFLAGKFMKGSGFGLSGNIVLGIVGAIVGGFVFGYLGIPAGGLVGAVVMATIGATLLLWIGKLLK